MSYEKGHEILKDISFKLEPGSMHFLTGPSGSGKTSYSNLFIWRRSQVVEKF